MPDHVAVSRLVFDAAFAASVPHYQTAVAGKANVTPIFYMDNLAGVNFIPTEYVDGRGWSCGLRLSLNPAAAFFLHKPSSHLRRR